MQIDRLHTKVDSLQEQTNQLQEQNAKLREQASEKDAGMAELEKLLEQYKKG